MNSSIENTKRRILVIDDNDAIHSDFRKILTTRASTGLDEDEAMIFGDVSVAVPTVEFETDFALQGEEGYRKVADAVAAGRPYQVAFVDMRMPPGWDGVQTIKRLWDVDADLQVVICTAYSDYSWEQILEQLGSTDRMLILKKPFDDAEVCQLATALTAKHLVTCQARLKHAELEKLVVARTNEIKNAALVDRLTGLPNRQLLNDRLATLILQNARDRNRNFALLFLDFDRFKVVNDSLGHEIGDLLLIEIAERLRAELRKTDTVALCSLDGSTAVRLGGDEFIVVLDGVRDNHDAARVTERLLATLSAPYLLKGNVVHTTASIGITTSAVGYTSADDMIRDADTAMYRAKAAGKARYVLFDRKMHEEAMNRLTLENDLRAAIRENQFVLHYQPIVCLATGKPTGFEALVRWMHPQRGLISPLDFIPLAEEIGAIVPLGEWVLREACRQLALWRRHPEFAVIAMSVNLSRRQLTDPTLVTQVKQILEQTGINPESLKLEITESAVMEELDRGVCVLLEIHNLGVRLDLDDFGTGYSSLSCLHRFPIDGIKIDRSFVKNLADRRDHAAVVHAIVSLTHKLEIALVAEGIESLAQAELLQSMGCVLGQGYYYSRPLLPDAAMQFMLCQTDSQRIASAA